MKTSVNLLIAGTQLWARKRQSFIAMLGVLFGISMFIFMMSIMKGVNKYIQDTMLSAIPDIHIYNDIRTDYSSSITGDWLHYDATKMIVVHHPKPERVRLNLKNADAIISELKLRPEVGIVSPLLSTQVFFNYGSVQLNGVLDGVEIIEEARIFGLHERMITGVIFKHRQETAAILQRRRITQKRENAFSFDQSFKIIS